MKALIFQNKVLQVEQNEFPVATGMSWVTCDNTVEVGWDYVEGVFSNPNLTPTITLEAAKQIKLQELAAHRYTWETSGIEVGGQKISTDDRAKNLLTGAAIAAEKDPQYTINWKGEDGWVMLNAQQLIYIADSVRSFVQACFDNERNHDQAIQALTTVEAVESYDFSTNWP